MGDHLDGRPLYALDFDEAHALPPFERVLDLLGDGSIWAISTPGHSPNHVSYLVNAQSGPVLITGDACAYHAQFEHRIRPSPGVDDQEVADPLARRSSRALRSVPTAAGHGRTRAASTPLSAIHLGLSTGPDAVAVRGRGQR